MELISRDEAMRLLKEDLDASRSRGDDERADACLLHYIEISNLPTVEERKEGRWIDTDYINLQLDTYLASCSECGYQMNVHNNRGYFKYCPNCGAKMYEDDRDIYVLNKGE